MSLKSIGHVHCPKQRTINGLLRELDNGPGTETPLSVLHNNPTHSITQAKSGLSGKEVLLSGKEVLRALPQTPPRSQTSRKVPSHPPSPSLPLSLLFLPPSPSLSLDRSVIMHDKRSTRSGPRTTNLSQVKKQTPTYTPHTQESALTTASPRQHQRFTHALSDLCPSSPSSTLPLSVKLSRQTVLSEQSEEHTQRECVTSEVTFCHRATCAGTPPVTGGAASTSRAASCERATFSFRPVTAFHILCSSCAT